MRLPNDSQRLTVIGRTGSGKTIAGLWHLSERNYVTKPWVIFDFKGDKTIAEIPYAIDYSVSEPIPQEPGLYVVRPLPDDGEVVDDFLMRSWHKENIGLFFDEGYMIGNGKGDSKAFRALLTQGRSKNIPMIILSQRPAWLSRFALSEADFYQIFALNDIEDRRRVQGFLPRERINLHDRLPEYHSAYYDVGKDDLTLLSPVPNVDSILATFERRLAPVADAEPEKPRKIAI